MSFFFFLGGGGGAVPFRGFYSIWGTLDPKPETLNPLPNLVAQLIPKRSAGIAKLTNLETQGTNGGTLFRDLRGS